MLVMRAFFSGAISPAEYSMKNSSRYCFPVAIGLAATTFYFGRAYPAWVFWCLWITYGLACYDSFTAWWRPYLFRSDPQQVARYQTMYAATHSFLPERNDIRPNTLHVLFDIVTILAILIDLAVLTA
jgi:hypothetical protein